MSPRALKLAPLRIAAQSGRGAAPYAGERVQLAIPRRAWPAVHSVLLGARVTGVDAYAAGTHVHLSLSPEHAELLRRALPGVVTL